MHVERAPAKLTVSLRVTGVRPDGYHLIDAEMVTLDYGDVLTFEDGDGLDVVGPHAAGVPTGENLVRRALAAVGRRVVVAVDHRRIGARPDRGQLGARTDRREGGRDEHLARSEVRLRDIHQDGASVLRKQLLHDTLRRPGRQPTAPGTHRIVGATMTA